MGGSFKNSFCFLDVYEAEQLLKEVDIHSVTGMFKMYLRELPEALFTDALYQKFFRAFSKLFHKVNFKAVILHQGKCSGTVWYQEKMLKN